MTAGAPVSKVGTLERRYLNGTFAELCRIESPSGQERDCAERCEGGFLKAHAFGGNGRDQQARNAGKLGMDGLIGAGTSDSITGIDVGNAFADSDDSSGTTVA